jgi:hypothetical protein
LPKGVYIHLKLSEMHKSNCPCCICKAIRGEQIHNVNCQCVSCRYKRGERIKHKPNCQCCYCKGVRGETKGINNPMYDKHHTKEAKGIMRKRRKEGWQNPEYREKQLTAMFKSLDIKPNKPEQLLNKLL